MTNNSGQKRRRLPALQKPTPAVLLSLVGVALLAASCTARVTQTQPTPISGSVSRSSIGTGGKTQPGRVMAPAFANAGRAKGLEVWRIENFEPVPYPKNNYGKFFTGDSYIVLNTKENKKKEHSWDVHFWLGSKTSTDEAGAAAIFTVQLDDLLNGAPVQHREVQDHESQLFLSYFPSGVRYEEGGVASGFRATQINDPGEKRLFQVKGKRNVRVRQVNPSVSSMNRGDCFILDAGNDIYVYIGASAKRVEKLKAISAANQIRDQDHSGRSKVDVIDEFSTDSDREKFFTVLGDGSPDTVPSETTAEEDAAFERAEEIRVTLYKVSDFVGQLTTTQVGHKPLTQELLDSGDCFILDTGSGIFVWVGRGASQEEKSQAMQTAQNFLIQKNYPSWTHVHRVVEGAETAPFKQYFATWRDVGMAHTRLIRAAEDMDTDDDEAEDVDPSLFQKYVKSGGHALGFMPDNGEGEIENVWRIANYKVSELPKEMYGMFYGGDSYVVKYNYKNKRGETGTVLYFWQGQFSSPDEQAAAAIEAARLDKEMGGSAIQVRVVQSNEPRHFRKIFKGQLITFFGGSALGKKNIHDPDTFDRRGVRLFRIRGTAPDDVRADQRQPRAASLSADDAFVIENKDTVYIWRGAGATDTEKQVAADVANRINNGKQVEEVEEGLEPMEFWDALGGRMHYEDEINQPQPPILEPRLFHCRIVNDSKFIVEEVPDFTQEDLDVDDVMVLDGGDEVYVWIGEGSTIEEREKSLDMAYAYLRSDPTERSEKHTPVIKVQHRHEFRSFKRLFPSWNDKLWE